MNTLVNIEFATAALLHDLSHIINLLELPRSLRELPMKSWFSSTELFFYVLEHHMHDTLNSQPLTQHRIAAEIIAQAENLSLGITATSLGELSPMKSFFQTISCNKENSEHFELFFQTSELGEDILLDLHQSKKDLYFAPSYVVSSFLDDLSVVFKTIHNPQPNIIYYLFKKYFWSFALSRHGTDVSFSVYDHGKMTCALACALHAFLQENHKTIFVSQNSRFIRDVLSDPIEERFLFLKIAITQPESFANGNSALSVENHYIAKSILLWAAQNILSKFGLFDCSIFTVSPTYLILILPNLKTKNMSEIIQCLNTQLFLKYGVNWLISYQLLALKNNDLTPHMSSHTNCASLFWQKVLPEIHSANFFDLPFFTENHELFFQPKHNKKERVDQSCPNSYTPAILNINVSPQPVPPADTLEKLSDVSSHNTAETHTCFFALDPDTIISSVRPSIFSVSSSSDYYCFTGEDDSDIKVALNVAISNYEQYNTSFPTITQIHALFSQTEFFMQYHLRKKISAIGEFALLWSANNHILFAVKSPHSLENCMEIIHTEYNRFFNSSPITALCAHIYFSSNRIPKPVKSPLTAMHDYCVFDGEVISWDTLSLILDTAQKIISLVKNCSVVDQKKFYMGLQRFTQCGIFSFDTIKDIPELLQSVHNKRLMAKWILHMQKGIHNER